MGQAAPAGKTIKGKEIILSNDAGVELLKLRATEHGPLIALFDKEGNAQAGLGAFGDGASLTLFDEKGRPRVMVGTVGTDEPGIVILDENGQETFSRPRKW